MRTRSLVFSALFLWALVGTAACSDDDKNEPTPCDPLAQDCPEGEVCNPLPEGGGECVPVDVCDPAAPDCPEDQICARQPNGEYWCVAPLVCDPSAPTCPDDQICLRQPDGGFQCLVPEPCDIAAPDCAEGELCLTDGSGTAWCHPSCDPNEPDQCAADQACDLLDTGEYACLEPVVITGMVFDVIDASAIGDALVAAADDTGAVVTDVAVTDATGDYELQVPVTRDATGTVLKGLFTLRAAAADYVPYPSGIRPAIPVDVTGAGYNDGRYLYSNLTTDIGLIPLPSEEQGHGSISGTVQAENAGGTLVVAECTASPCPTGFADKSGAYTIFNVPDGSYTVKGYKAFLFLQPEDVTLSGNPDLTGIDLLPTADGTGTISGSVNIVNPGDGDLTSVVLVPESTFQQLSDTFVRGEVPPGLRSPPPPAAPDVSNAFAIHGVPAGRYVVLAAFENDFLVRDPDPGISGTQIVHVEIPAPGTNDVDITIGSSFKVTGALTMVGPGAEGPEAVEDPDNLMFVWVDDSSEDYYTISLWDAYGNLIWHDGAVPRVTGANNVEVVYPNDATPLEAGMYYQWRAESWRNSGPISTTEDLLGVFYIPSAVN